MKLNVSDINKSYNGKAVLQDCSVSFEKGAVYALMGPNGSGKSTFLRICALLETPDKGSVEYLSGDSIVRNDIGLRRRITLVLPGVGVFNTTVHKNVVYGLKIRGLSKEEIRRRADSALEFAGLLHKKDHNALTLSTGEGQRLGIARAMVIEPEILFLDEPTVSTDQENTAIIEGIILDMKKKGMSTVIITTHDPAQAERLTDRVLIMRDGKIIEQKSP
ncbi:putative amino-acid import ATP-binding protein YxeO [bacterium BMS3Abin10]|nr:putative amino-acid import ATP-binding protein YxeO [bacterium BMS3Abin10]GBE38037.1 putative amino-acid import ATP-binding protein YxeO [bacterium BMS3Bbin08]